ncbi:choice-of-anchor tandem repeat GloVer-containing protein [Mesoflavibacter zeaxanthinifaciens]|uniref:choice-of-anchor tandem repeat GloVer-containing protein n=1 Tax=Mesoflavibacter zeaxanthinifaciens TaxID=393060 RepID=UPI000412DB20|nr:choice-of-anchor tandem repeat GloVer-containing protein [Mesoflavibacter zeaxanthinifaciens]
MKKILLILLLPLIGFTQTNYLAFSDNNDANSFGSIITINDDVPQTGYTFTDNGALALPSDNLLEINGKIYGITTEYSVLGKGALYEYDYSNGTSSILYYFEPLDYISNLCTDGTKIYGTQTQFFTGTSIIEFDINTQTITPLVSLSSIGVSEVKDLIFTTNNKIYGVSRPDTGTNVMFSYDLTSNSLTNEFTFNSNDGHWCHSIMEHSNGNIYGATTYGGTNDEGVIFEFNTTNNTYSKLYDLTTTNKADNLVEGNSNQLYGYTNPITGGGARIYQFDLNTNSFNNIYSFPANIQPKGNAAWFRDFNPLFFSNDKLLGVSLLLNSNEQVFFEYDVVTNTASNILNGLDDGIITTSIIKTIDNRIVYGNRIHQGNGNLIEYDINSQTTSELLGTNFGTDGKTPNKMIKSSTGIIYGVTADNFTTTYDDKLFSFDPNTNQYNVLLDFATEPTFIYGNNPINLIETTDGLIYIYTSFGALASQQGSLIEYDPSTGNHQLAHEFSDLYDGNTIGEYVELFEKDNIIYGIKRWGGNSVLYKGTIFSYNTVTHTYSVLYESDDLASTGASLLTSQGIIYGVTSTGGTNGNGYVFSYDIQTNQFLVIENITNASISDFVEVTSGDVYGVLQNSHGVDGSVFKIDGITGLFSVYYQFDNAVNGTGQNPTAIYAANDNLYVESQTVFQSDGKAFSYYLTEFNINTNNVSLLYDGNTFNNPNGTNSRIWHKNISIMNDDRLLAPTFTGTPLSLVSYNQGDTAMSIAYNFNSDIETTFNIIDLNDAPLSTEEFESDVNISIYPNPTTDFINIKSKSEINKVEIYNLQGQKVISFQNHDLIDVKVLSEGIYFLKVIDKSMIINTLKFIKN